MTTAERSDMETRAQQPPTGVERVVQIFQFEALLALKGEAQDAQKFPLNNAMVDGIVYPTEVFTLEMDKQRNQFVICTRNGMARATIVRKTSVEDQWGAYPNLDDVQPAKPEDAMFALEASRKIKAAQTDPSL